MLRVITGLSPSDEPPSDKNHLAVPPVRQVILARMRDLEGPQFCLGVPWVRVVLLGCRHQASFSSFRYHLATLRTSRGVPEDLIWLARAERTTTLPLVYPRDGMILSSVGLPGPREPGARRIPRAGHRFGMKMSSRVRLNESFLSIARCLAHPRRRHSRYRLVGLTPILANTVGTSQRTLGVELLARLFDGGNNGLACDLTKIRATAKLKLIMKESDLGKVLTVN